MDSPLSTLAFFNLFGCPLTARELWRLSPEPNCYREFLNNLTQHGCEARDGFYSLTDGAANVAERQRRYILAGKKYRRARRAARWFALLPWVRLVALVNQIGAHNLRQDGDLDFFIVTTDKRLWLSRLILSGCLKILGLRPGPKGNRDTLCLSFWVSESAVNLNDYRLQPDPYFTYWLAYLMPLIDKNKTYQRLLNANRWLTRELPNWAVAPNDNKEKSPPHSGQTRLDHWEQRAKAWQLKIMPESLIVLANQDTRVVVNDQVIKLHPNDRRREFIEQQISLEQQTANSKPQFIT